MTLTQDRDFEMRFVPKACRPQTFRLLAVLVVAAWSFLAVCADVSAQGKAASRVHVLVVADTDAPGAAQIGLGIDGDNVKRVFDELFTRSNRADQYALELFTGNRVSPQNILDYYANLKTNPNETVVFYYTGHGITDQNQGHLITTHKGFLSRKALLDAMEKKNPQLVVLLTDCCANYGNPNKPFPGAPFKAGALPDMNPLQALTSQLQRQAPALEDRVRPKTDASTPPVDPVPPKPATSQQADLIANLFLQHKGLVDMNAAEMGKSASGSAGFGGSYFTIALVKQLRKAIKDIDRSGDGFAEWREFFPHLHGSTLAESAKANFVQQPQAFSLGEAMK